MTTLMNGVCFCEKCSRCSEHLLVDYCSNCPTNKCICLNCHPNAAEFLSELVTFLESQKEEE